MRNGPIALDESFSVIDETDDWIVVNKGAPLIVHPANDLGVEATLLGGVEGLLAYDIANGCRLSIINRLDRETSGIVVIAKNKGTARLMGRAMERRQIQKGYVAFVFGWPEWDEVSVDVPILRAGEIAPSEIWVKQLVHESGRECLTHFCVEGRKLVGGREISKLRVQPRTGRMHQIRVHAAYLGFPLVGDKIYGEKEECYLDFIESGWSEQLEKELILPRHALHSCEMSMVCNEDGDELSWRAPLAGDLESFWGGGTDFHSLNHSI